VTTTRKQREAQNKTVADSAKRIISKWPAWKQQYAGFEMKFYDYLKTQFHDLTSCIEWYHCTWINKWDQDIPGRPEWNIFTQRAMARHCSNVLEGKNIEQDGDCYLDTKHGPAIFYGEGSGW
jgi:hypothetical protein